MIIIHQITKLIVERGQIKIYHSDEVIDKRDCYNIRFDSFYKGYFDYFVSKEIVSKNIPITNQLKITLFVSSSKFLKDKNYWIEFALENYRKNFSKYGWYIEPKF